MGIKMGGLGSFIDEFREGLLEDFVEENEELFFSFCQREYAEYLDDIETKNEIARARG